MQGKNPHDGEFVFTKTGECTKKEGGNKRELWVLPPKSLQKRIVHFRPLAHTTAKALSCASF